MPTVPGVPHLPIIRPDIALSDVQSDLEAVFASGVLTRGPYVERFEAAFAERVGADHAVAVTSATTALHLALVAAGVGPGDEVLVSDFTFPASGNAVLQAGATPVLVDSAPGRFELDVGLAASLVTPRTAAVLHVDPFGQPADLADVRALAQRHGLFALEDAACAVGASYDGIPCGAWPGASAFSFHPRKLLTTAEGGAVTTSDAALAARMRRLRSHGSDAGPQGLAFIENGFNYRMNEIQAVMGLAQLRRLEDILADRAATAAVYDRLLVDVPGLELPHRSPRSRTNHQSYVIWLQQGLDRAGVQAQLRDVGIETTLGTYAMHAHPAFGPRGGHRPGDLPHSYAAQERSLTLPLVPRMAVTDVERVVAALSRAMSGSA